MSEELSTLIIIPFTLIIYSFFCAIISVLSILWSNKENNKASKTDDEIRQDLLNDPKIKWVPYYKHTAINKTEITNNNNQIVNSYNSQKSNIIKPKQTSNYVYNMELKVSLQRRKIRNLVHFTNINNLNSILEMGTLYCRDEIPSYARVSDKQRFDGRKDCICFSVEKPNWKYLKKLEYTTREDYCILVVDASKVLLDTKNKKYFFSTNAANSKFRISNGLYLLSVDAFDNMFNSLYDKYPKDIQAEILFKGNIASGCIKWVLFKTKEEAQKYSSRILTLANAVKKGQIKVGTYNDLINL